MNYLLPRKFRIVGFAFTSIGISLAVLRFYFGIKPKFLETKVFAVYSRYFESSYLKVISNQISEELTALFLILGLLIICFSKEQNENEITNQIRLKSLVLAIYFNTGFILFSIVFIYGFIFINILVINLFSLLILYFVVFRILVFISKH